jgi:hypothetical protein
MRGSLFPAAVLSMAAALAAAWSQEVAERPAPAPVEREKLFLAGWDPDEPVPADVYYRKGNKAMPVVLFVHGLGGSKDQYVKRPRGTPSCPCAPRHACPQKRKQGHFRVSALS